MKPRELIFDGVKSTDFGMIIAGDTVYNAPARRYNMVQIPGRNGDLAIDDESFENIPVTYPSAIHAEDQEEFAKRMRAIRNAILSKSGYRRLVDTYHPDEFRMGIFKSGLEVNPYHFNESGKFDLVFDCKPQRFLTAGEEEINVGEWGETEEASGEIATFEGKSNTGIKSLIAEINPIQNLNGYDAPWPGGARKNKLKITATSKTINGVTFTFRSDGRIGINGTPTGPVTLFLNESLGLPNGNYKYFAKGFPSTTIGGFYAENADGNRILSAAHDSQSGVAINNSIQKVWLYFNINQSFSNAIVELMITDSSVTDSTFEPYENVCPITGIESLKAYITGDNPMKPSPAKTETNNGITFSSDGKGTYRIKGYATANASSSIFPIEEFIIPPSSTHTVFFNNSEANAQVALGFRKGSTTIDAWGMNPANRTNAGYGLMGNKPCDGIIFTVNAGNTVDMTIRPVFARKTELQKITKSLGRVVYGGRLNFISGVLTVTHEIYSFTGNETIATATIGGHTRFGVSNVLTQNVQTDSATYAYCSHFLCRNTPMGGNAIDNAMGAYQRSIYWRADSFADANTMKTYFANQSSSGTPCIYVGRLATPLTYQLTPEQIETLLGVNNIWADSGEVTVVFGDDPNIMANPTAFQSKPLIIATGSGTLTVGDVSIAVAGESGKDIYIDSEAMEAYSIENGEVVSKNNKIALSGNDFPKLGEDTKVSFTGLSAVKVIPRWWTI